MSQLSLLTDFIPASSPVPVHAPARREFVSQAAFSARDYQQRGIDKAFELWGEGSHGVIFRQPTGSGKTVSGALIAERWCAQGENYHAIVIAHERQLVQQFSWEIEDVLGESAPIEMADQKAATSRLAKVIVASRATIKESDDKPNPRLRKFDNALNWLVIIDECHRWKWGLSSCKGILEWFAQNPKSKRLGLSATPERSDKVSLRKLFPDIASDYRLFDAAGGVCAVDDGWAVTYDQRFVTVEGVDFKNLREVAGDFTDEELGEKLTQREALLSLVKPTIDLVGERRTIIFNPTVAMAKAVAGAINSEVGADDLAVSLDGSYPDAIRRDVYRRHQRGDFQFLSVCGLCREGYNDPGIQAVAIFRPTKSRPLAEQMKGRGCRPLKGVVDGLATPEARRAAIAASAKPNCMIVDLVGVTGLADCASTASILAAGLEDEAEVVNRANAAAAAKSEAGEAVDMNDEVRKAARDLREERERARLARIAREEAERLEAERLGKIRGDVRYSERKVEQGQGGSVRRSSERKGPCMMFGKHKGEPIESLNTNYLRTFAEKVPPTKRTQWMFDAIGRELAKRRGEPMPTKAARSVPKVSSIDDANRLFMEAAYDDGE